MNARQLTRELRRIARREVPNGEPDLWPRIRRQVATRRTPYSSPANPGNFARSESSSGSPELSSVYVWSADSRPSRFGSGTRLLAAGAALALIVVVLAVVLGNRGSGDKHPVGAIGSPAPTNQPITAATPFFSSPATPPPSWTSHGALTLQIDPVAGSGVSGTVDAQILPTGDLRISTHVDSSNGFIAWHAVTLDCRSAESKAEQDLASQDVIASFLQYGGRAAIVPAQQTRQPLTMVAIDNNRGKSVGCATIPAVPETLQVAYDPGPGVPRTCPVTVPGEPLFTPPAGTPVDPYVGDGDFWYGSSDLWTGLPLDGIWPANEKLFWWSDSYNVNVEPVPALTMHATRLDGNSPPINVNQATNADGIMLAGIDFPANGCWKITGSYKNTTISFVAWVHGQSQAIENQAPGPVPEATPNIGADGLTHTDQACHASSFGPSTAKPSDVNVEFRGIASSGQFWALLFQPLPLYANQPAEIALKVDSADPLSVTFEDTEGTKINPVAGPDAIETANWPRPGTPWLSTFNFPHSGCWHLHAEAGSFSGDMWFEVFSPPASTVSDCVNTGAAALLSTFVDAFNRDDQSALGGMLPQQAASGNSWLAAVTTGDGSSTTGDTLAMTASDFLRYIDQRHAQGEQLRVTKVLNVARTWLPGYVDVVADLHRQANDLPAGNFRVIAMLSCEQQQIGSWSIGAASDSANIATLTGDALIEDTLRQRPLHISADLPGGICPADTAHSVDPQLSSALGSGPLYVVMGEADAGGVLHLHPTNDDAGWTFFKVVWTSDPGYSGPVLVRGAQIGGSNALGFNGTNPPDSDLYFMAPSGNFTEVTYTRVKDDAPGCYAYQVDGLNFSEIIVINVQK